MKLRPSLKLLNVALAAAFLLPAAAPGVASAVPLKAALSPEEREAGLWYTQDLKFDEIREMGLTGKGVTIAVIDSAINLDAAELQGANIEVKGQFCKDPSTGETEPAETVDTSGGRGHGTSVVSMLVGNGIAADGGLGTRGIVPDATVLFYAHGKVREKGDGCVAVNPVSGKLKYSDFVGDNKAFSEAWLGYGIEKIRSDVALAAAQAIEDGADIISVSLGGDDPFEWYFVQSLAMRAGVVVVSSVQNPSKGFANLSGSIPYSVNGVVAVSGVDQQQEPISVGEGDGTGLVYEVMGSTNLAFAGPATNMLVPEDEGKWEAGISQGTSFATPLAAGMIALGLERYPEASGFQVLQSMIRTTGNGEYAADPVWLDEQYGYGLINPVAMLSVDPTKFPNDNPLFVMGYEDPRCGAAAESMKECKWGMAEPTAEQVWPAGNNSAEAEATGSADEGTSIVMVSMVLGLLVLGLIATAVVVPISVLRLRKRKRALQGASMLQRTHSEMSHLNSMPPTVGHSLPTVSQGYPQNEPPPPPKPHQLKQPDMHHDPLSGQGTPQPIASEGRRSD